MRISRTNLTRFGSRKVPQSKVRQVISTTLPGTRKCGADPLGITFPHGDKGVISQDFKGKTELIEIEGSLYIRKSLDKLLGSKRFARFLMKRQFDAIKVLQGVKGIPALLGDFDLSSNAFYYKYIYGERLNDARFIPDDFFDNLLGLMQDTWKRGIIHGNIGAERNILVDKSGDPFLVDFETAVTLRNSMFSRWLFKTIKREDIYHLYKLKLAYKPLITTEIERRIGTKSSLLRHIYNAIYVYPRNIILRISRRILP